MNKTLRLVLLIPATIIAYMIGYFTTYYSQKITIEMFWGGNINKGINSFTFPMLCSGVGIWVAVYLGCLISPLAKKNSLKVFFFVLIILLVLSAVTFYTNGFTSRTLGEMIGLTAGYFIAKINVLQEEQDENEIENV